MAISPVYRQYRPGANLAAHVECYWTWQGDGLSGREERLIPGGRVELLFNLGDDIQWMMDGAVAPGLNLRGAWIMGQRDRLFFYRASRRVRLFGIRFRPGSFAAFSPVPLHLLLNRLLPASECFGKTANCLPQQLHDATDDICRMVLLETWLHSALQRPLSVPVHFALETLRNGEGVSIEDLCDQAGWGYKRMERAFLKEVGYTPKGYSRLVRFNKAIRRLGGEDSLTSVGYACGYYDQAHFIRDFSRFAGMTPGQFRVEENPVAELLIRHQAV